MAQARAHFQCKGEPGISLCADNARRKQINEETNRRLAPQNAQLLESSDGPILLYPGLELVGSRIAHGILNGVWYKVVALEKETLHLLDDKDIPIDITLEKAKSCLQLRHALTVHKSQSKTIEGHVRICPGKAPGHVSPYWSLSHLLVAASRARSVELLSIE